MKSYAVIGAGFGDEGKGLMTDYLARRLNSAVVARFNGGGQASHTVQTTSGKRHVFSHVGSGTFAGAGTYLGKNFIVNPYILDTEMAELQYLGYRPTIYCHENAPVTTIFDMALNAAAELSRGQQRHGSCGIGINETVTRHLAGFALTASDVRNMSRVRLESVLQIIREKWVPERLKGLGLDITDLPENFHLRTGEVLRNDNYAEHAVRLLMGMAHLTVSPCISDDKLDEVNLVLEGAQGLMLDEELGTFPHVTRSLTGLPYAIETADWAWHQELAPIYVTRAYATRHGAGSLAHEGEQITEGGSVQDTTNVRNEWQGQIRFAPLDLAELTRFIRKDLERGSKQDDVKICDPVLAITCLDQLGTTVTMYDSQHRPVQVPRDDIVEFVQRETGLTVGYTSFGPTAEDVVPVPGIGV